MRIDDLTCPFCGLLCDDLSSTSKAESTFTVECHGCELGTRGFANADRAQRSGAHPTIDGANAGLGDAINASAALIASSSRVIVGGLGTDVNGARQAVALAEHCGGVIDHANTDALFRNLRVLQDNGWFNTTLTEAKNRADIVIILGSDVLDKFPRLINRVLGADHAALGAPGKTREWLYIGPNQPNADLLSLGTQHVDVPMHRLGDTLRQLRARLHGRPCKAAPDGPDDATLDAIVNRLRTCSYSVFVWSASDLDTPHADLTVEAITELTRDLNATTRSAGLPLSGTNGDLGANQVCTWQTGYPLRTSFERGFPQFDPVLFDAKRLIACGEADLLIWISTLDVKMLPPPSDVPTIVIGHPLLELESEPAVFIPVGVPGVHAQGHMFRTDSVTTLPLRAPQTSSLPHAAQVLEQLRSSLPQTHERQF